MLERNSVLKRGQVTGQLQGTTWLLTVMTTPAQGFSTSDTVGISDRIILCCEGCSVWWRMSSSLPGLSPLDAGGTLLVLTLQNV